ncbi:MAG: hypothetical protein KKB13_14435, partial [Chloroflexi bacterium]|nr:hypothetical protein [Chloroflexota bacterium]
MSNTRTKTITVILLTLILVALLPPATTQAAPVTQTGAVTAVTGWAYANSRGTGAGTYVVR